MLLLPRIAPEPVCEEAPELSKGFQFYRNPISDGIPCKVYIARDRTQHAGYALEMRFDDPDDDAILRNTSFLTQDRGVVNERTPNSQVELREDDVMAELKEFRKTLTEEKEVTSGEKIIKRGVWNQTNCVVALPQNRGYWMENRHALLNEFSVLKCITEAESGDKDSIIRLLSAIIDIDTPRVITELVRPLGYDMNLVIRKHAGYDLQQRETAFMPETELCGYLLQIIGAANFMHANFIIHRDLKPENVLVTDKLHVFDEVRRVNQIKLIDFGCAAVLKEGGICRDRLDRDAPNIAPEVLKRQPHGKKVDSYGIGWIVDRAAFEEGVCDTGAKVGNQQLEPWIRGLMDENLDQRWALDTLSSRINERLLSQEKEQPFHSHLNALGMIIKIEGMIAKALLGEALQPVSLMTLGLRTKGLHVVFASSAEKLTNPGGKDIVKNGDRVLAIIDPTKGTSARPKDLKNILGVSSAEGRVGLNSRTLEDNHVLPCFVEFDEVEMPLLFFTAHEQCGTVVCILGPKTLPNGSYLSDEEKERLREDHVKNIATDSIVIRYLNLQRNLSGFNVSGIARSGTEGDEYIWPDPKKGIIQGDRLLLARFDSSNIGSSKSMFDVEKIRVELLKLAADVETDVVRPVLYTENSHELIVNDGFTFQGAPTPKNAGAGCLNQWMQECFCLK